MIAPRRGRGQGMKLIKYGTTSNGGRWGIAEDDYGFWLITGSTIFNIYDAIAEETYTEVYPSYARALEAAKEI